MRRSGGAPGRRASPTLSRMTSPVSGSTRAWAGSSEIFTVKLPGGLLAAGQARLRLAVEAGGDAVLDLVGAGLDRRDLPLERLRRARADAPERPRVRVRGDATARAVVDDPHRPLRVGEARLLGPRGEPVDGHREVRDRLRRRCARARSSADCSASRCCARELRLDDVDRPVARRLVGVLALRRRRSPRRGAALAADPRRPPPHAAAKVPEVGTRARRVFGLARRFTIWSPRAGGCVRSRCGAGRSRPARGQTEGREEAWSEASPIAGSFR